MGMSEEYQKVIDLLVQLNAKVSEGRIQFSDLGVDLIAELAEAGFEMDYSEEEKQAYNKLVLAYVQGYKSIAALESRQAEMAYLEMMICSMRSWALLVQRQEESLMKQIKNRQKNILPPQFADMDCKNEKHIQMDVRELFLQQNASIVDLDYQRLDVVVKYLAIENYFHKNDYGFALHEKLQALRKRQSGEMPENYEALSRMAFLDLISSIEKNGFREDSEIICDSRLFLLDGAHRMAACLYFKVPQVRVKVVEQEINIIPFTMDYLREGGFTEAEVCIIREKAEELMNTNKVSISCILWPPVAKYFERITNEIANACRVVDSQDYVYSEETFARLVKAVYHIDDIADWKVDKKLAAMKNCAVKKVRVLQVDILAPYFRLKDLNNHTISVIGERLKNIIRTEYKDLVDDYIYDIIVHTGDNFVQSEYMEKLFKQAISLEDYFCEIQDLNYFLIKHETPYLPEDFPKTYAFSKDIDIICEENQYVELISRTSQYLREKVEGYELRMLDTEKGTLFRIELNGYLIIQIDISFKMQGICREFWKQALARRTKERGFYLPVVADEICIRANEYRNNPNKIHHLEYLKKYKADLDKELLETYLLGDKAAIKEIEALI